MSLRFSHDFFLPLNFRSQLRLQYRFGCIKWILSPMKLVSVHLSLSVNVGLLCGGENICQGGRPAAQQLQQRWIACSALSRRQQSLPIYLKQSSCNTKLFSRVCSGDFEFAEAYATFGQVEIWGCGENEARAMRGAQNKPLKRGVRFQSGKLVSRAGRRRSNPQGIKTGMLQISNNPCQLILSLVFEILVGCPTLLGLVSEVWFNFTKHQVLFRTKSLKLSPYPKS